MNKTPKLRFKEFSGNWESKKVVSVFDRVSNKVDVIEDEYYEQIGIRSHGKGIFYKEPVSGKELGNKRVFWVEPDVFVVNIVFAWEQAVAKTTQSEVGMIASHRFPMYRPKENILDLDYITQLFKTPKGKFLLGLASPGGAGRNKTLGQKEFDDLDVVLPSYDEQKKISTFISLIDKKLIKQGEKVEALIEYKKGLMQKIFSQEIRFKDTNGGNYPEWKVKKLKDIIKQATLGGNYANTESISKYPLIKMGNISRGYIDISKVEYISQSETLNENDILQEGDLLFNTRNTLSLVGKVAIWRNELELACYNSNLLKLVFKEDDIEDNYFMNYLFNSNEMLGKLKSIATGTTSVAAIYMRDLEQIKFRLPSKEEQKKIGEILLKLDIKIKKEQEKLDYINKYKKGLLQQMFI